MQRQAAIEEELVLGIYMCMPYFTSLSTNSLQFLKPSSSCTLAALLWFSPFSICSPRSISQARKSSSPLVSSLSQCANNSDEAHQSDDERTLHQGQAPLQYRHSRMYL